MKKRYGVGFLLGIILLILIALFIFAYDRSYNHALEKNNTVERTKTEQELCYYIKESDGYVTVYEHDGKTVYEYTTILVNSLPEEIQEKLKDGIKVTSLGQVYGFLENYSS